MKVTDHPARPFVAAGLLFLGCAGLLLLMNSTRPAKPAEAAPGTVERLETPRIVQSVPCSGYVRLDPAGRLESCVLSQDHTLGGAVLPANTQVRRFRPDGTAQDVHLGRDARFDGHLCRGEGPGSWMTGFHPDGRLDYCFLVDRETIDGLPCERGTFWGEMVILGLGVAVNGWVVTVGEGVFVGIAIGVAVGSSSVGAGTPRHPASSIQTMIRNRKGIRFFIPSPSIHIIAQIHIPRKVPNVTSSQKSPQGYHLISRLSAILLYACQPFTYSTC